MRLRKSLSCAAVTSILGVTLLRRPPYWWAHGPGISSAEGLSPRCSGTSRAKVPMVSWTAMGVFRALRPHFR
jgi:hypothetical protein